MKYFRFIEFFSQDCIKHVIFPEHCYYGFQIPINKIPIKLEIFNIFTKFHVMYDNIEVSLTKMTTFLIQLFRNP